MCVSLSLPSASHPFPASMLTLLLPRLPGSQMADRIAALEAEKAALESRASGSKELGAGKQLQLQQSVPDDDPVLSQARLDLAETMRSKGVTEARLRTAEGELDKLRTKNRDDSRLIRNLESERASLMTKLKDRDYELREKRKLVEVGAHAAWDGRGRAWGLAIPVGIMPELIVVYLCRTSRTR